MKRRDFITLMGATAAAFPLPARARPADRLPRIGVLMGGAEHDLDWQRLESAFEQELKTLGWIRSRDLRIDYRWPGDDIDRINAYAIDLVETGPDLIVTAATPGVQAVRRRTDSIPVIFVNAVDPVGSGLVPNLAKPGGKTTGFAAAEYTITEKWLDIIKEIAPRANRIGLVFNPDTAPQAKQYIQVLEAPALARAFKPVAMPFRTDAEIERAIEEFARTANGGLLVFPGSSTAFSRRSIIETANKYKLPAVYPFRFFATSGGLVSFGVDMVAQCKGAASYVDRILRGQKPGDLPVQPATKFELVVNQKTAKAINIAMPPTLLSRASEVIE